MGRINNQTLLLKDKVKISMADNLVTPTQIQLLSIDHMVNSYLPLPHLMKTLHKPRMRL